MSVTTSWIVSFLQPQYRDKKNYTQNLHQLYHEGRLSARHREIYFGERPAEELYDVSIDPHMMVDLAGDSDFVDELGSAPCDHGRVARLRVIWARETNRLLPSKPMAKAQNGARV
jgi:hypothetical protein